MPVAVAGITSSSYRQVAPPKGYAFIPRTISNWIQNPAADSLAFSTLTLTARVALELPLPSTCSIAEYWLTPNNRWIWRFTATNMISFVWRDTAGVTQTRTSTIAWPFAALEWGWLRTTFTPNNGAGQHVLKHETSRDGVGWVPWQDVVTAGVTGVEALSSTLTVGNRGGTPGNLGLKGNISDLIVKHDAATSFEMHLEQNLAGVAVGAATFNVTSGQTVNVSRNSSPALVLYPPP